MCGECVFTSFNYYTLSLNTYIAITKRFLVPSNFLEGLQNVAVECCAQVGVVDRARGHALQHFPVLLHLVRLEALNRDLPMVYRDKLHQPPVVFDVYVRLFDLRLQIQNVLLLARLGLEEALKGGLSQGKILQLSLVVASRTLLSDLLLHDALPTFDRVNHALDVKHFSLDPQRRFEEGRFVLFDGVRNALLHVAQFRICQDSLAALANSVAEVVDGHILKLHELVVDARVVVELFRVLLTSIVEHNSIFLFEINALGTENVNLQTWTE